MFIPKSSLPSALATSPHQKVSFEEDINSEVFFELKLVKFSFKISSAKTLTKNLPEKSSPSFFTFLLIEKTKSGCNLSALEVALLA